MNEIENSQIISQRNLEKDDSNVRYEPSMEMELSFVHQDTILNSCDGNDCHEYAQKLNNLVDKNSANDPEKIQLDYTKSQTVNMNTQSNKNINIAITETNIKFENHTLNQQLDDKKIENNIPLILNTSCNVKSPTGIISN